MSEHDDLQRLIRLKRYEQPPEGYFEDFLDEFQRRQRSELLQRSSRSLFFERLGTYASGFGKQTWMLGAGAGVAYAMLMVYFFAAPDKQAPDRDGLVAEQGQEQVTPPPSVDLWRAQPDLWYVPADPSELLTPASDTGTLGIDPARQPERNEMQFGPVEYKF